MEDKAGQEIPVGRAHIIERPRLTRLLDETSARVIMLVAPAGYGKTTLARQWLATRPHVWYQGSAASADVASLALGLAEAAETLVSDVGRRLREWLPTSREPAQEIEVIERFLTEDLLHWPDEAWFVVDDYHLLSSEAAEDLPQRLFVSTGRRLLLTSRQRPAWSSARELLYGNFLELGQSSLAMNMDEANAVLASSNAEAAQGLVALADGWPAVIGLAALAPSSIALEDGFPDELHDYFAEELFASLSDRTREGLCRLALVPIVTRAAAETILGPESEQILAEARDAGMFSAPRAHELVLHPLLRTFLLQKLNDLPSTDLVTAVTRATEFLIQAGSWDEAFELIADFDRQDLLDMLLSQAIIPLTKHGRLATLREWLDFARRRHHASPYLDLTEAELSFRQGSHDMAENLARRAAETLNPGDPLKSAAYYRAGQSSYLSDETPRALQHFQDAQATALNANESRDALWGQFFVSLELELADASDKLHNFASVGQQDRDTMVRVAGGRLILAIRKGGLGAAISEATSLTDLVPYASDPIVRSSFWHVYAAALTLTANYSASLGAVDDALREIDSSGIEFGRPHALVSRAAACIGLGSFQAAAATLDEIDELASKRRDDYVLTNAKTVRCRLLLEMGEPDAALATISDTWARAPSRCMQAEFLVTRAAALACAGDPETAISLLDQVEKLSTYIEPQLLSQWVRTLCSVMLQDPHAADCIRQTYDQSVCTGALDTFVFAYRLHPLILPTLTEYQDLHDSLSRVLAQANDVERSDLRSAAPTAPGKTGGTASLTNRESEVYRLLAKGLTNREIAATLFISEVTAKVHVRNILRKLGVRTRTQAALKAVKDGTSHQQDP